MYFKVVSCVALPPATTIWRNKSSGKLESGVLASSTIICVRISRVMSSPEAASWRGLGGRAFGTTMRLTAFVLGHEDFAVTAKSPVRLDEEEIDDDEE